MWLTMVAPCSAAPTHSLMIQTQPRCSSLHPSSHPHVLFPSIHIFQSIHILKYCKHCKMYIANIAKYVFTTGIPFTIFEWFENYIMYSCSNFFYCQNVGSSSHFFVLCTSCTLHECLADLLYKRQGGKGSLVAHLSNCEVLPPTKSRFWTTMLRLLPALALLHYSLAATTAPLVFFL